ncbi:hypothetical protein KC330_g8687 [Hortaea werneckii]|nr:hypothetical protein KC330_g8687 [Hortaea werneckii]
MSAHRDDQPRMLDAIRSLSATARANNEGHEPALYTGLNKVAASLQATMEKMQQNFDTKVAKDMADIREATAHLTNSTRAKDRLEALELSEQTKQAQIDRLSQRIVEVERQTAAQSNSLAEAEDKIAAQSNSLAGKNDELATKEQEIQDLAAQCESLQKQVRKRPATPLSSFRSRDHPQATAASEENRMSETSEESVRPSTPNLSEPAESSSESPSSPREIVEQQLEQLGVRLAFVTVNNGGRLCSRICSDGELKDLMLNQLASYYTKLGKEFLPHLSESHKCVGCSITNGAPHWTAQGPELYTFRACYNAQRACIKRRGDRLQMMLLPDDALKVQGDLISNYVNLTKGNSRSVSLRGVWQTERAPALSRS